jgi:NADH:ubiquinone oxidoreductase subunit 5 (subunit L)/multisubunit Na+/H+ antiporter MnhA subunit
MENSIIIFLVLPLLGFLIDLIIPKEKELWLSKIATYTTGLQLIISIGFVLYWIFEGGKAINVKEFSIYQSKGYDFFIDFYFDKISATFLVLGAFLTSIVTVYSKYYMHREQGYKRFFNTILFFYLGYNIVILSGNLETLFIGWEMLGISSFLLIGFYRDRYLPVRNSLKVFSIYRVGDVGLILAMWLSHHLFETNIAFYAMNNDQLVHEHLVHHTFLGATIAILIFLSASVKSAQMPFSFWLPRAMEGPTPSSAVFYGSLSVHIGAYLMLRTFPFWENQLSVKIFVIIIGLLTSILSTMSARVQATVKSQVAYSSIAQIGLIFIEIALGWEDFALVHIVGNAFMRTYQLLVSPSVVSYQIREQFYNFKPRQKSIEDHWSKRIQNGLFLLSLKEWNLDRFAVNKIWNRLKKLGQLLDFLSMKNLMLIFIPLFVLSIYLWWNESLLPSSIYHTLPSIFGFIGLLFVVKSFTESQRFTESWTLVVLNHFWIALAVSFNAHFSISHTIIYLSGVIISAILGFVVISYLRKQEKRITLGDYNGHAQKHPWLAFAFLLAALGVAGFPITPTFIGEDLVFSHIKDQQVFLAVVIALSLILNGLAAIRIFARIFLGPYLRTYLEKAYRSS